MSALQPIRPPQVVELVFAEDGAQRGLRQLAVAAIKSATLMIARSGSTMRK